MLGSAPADGEPIYPTVGLNDRLGAIGVAFGVLSALVARQRTGVGQLVETSLLGWMVNLQAIGAEVAANVGQDPRPPRREQSNNPLYSYYRCSDGTWVALGMMVHVERYWTLTCAALGRPELENDERFADHAARERNCRELIEIFDDCFAKLTFDEWQRAAKTHDLISTKINTLPDLKHDEQVLANNYLVEEAHPDLGSWWYAPTPVRFSQTPVSFRSATRQCGQDNVAVLQAAGYTDHEIDALATAHVI
jgi:crotonobetainyl-CoA:carnitine CoA-transferase CaiB-like acyl-CoA transferase